MNLNKKILLNLYGSPGAGKSTMRAGLFYFLKSEGIKCEEAIEYAKGKVYEGSDPVLKNQVYVFGKQHHMTVRSLSQVDLVISESPLLFSIIYGEKSEPLKQLVLHEYNKFHNLNYLLVRPEDRPYEEYGRMQNEAGSNEIGNQIKIVLDDNLIPYTVLQSTHESLLQIISEVKDVLKKVQEND